MNNLKDFDGWNEVKKDIDKNFKNKFYHPKEIWWCSLGINIGNEQNGHLKNFQRPVLVLRQLSRRTCIILPLTTSSNVHRYRISIGKVSGQNASVILSQIKVIDTKRFLNKINNNIDDETFEQIRKAVRELF